MNRSNLFWIVLAGALFASGNCRAADQPLPTPPQARPAFGFHSDGIFDESYFRQMRQPMRSYIEVGGMPQANGGTSYGFPMRSYRWGWFGAEPHYPSVSWRQGYYGDSAKVVNRPGY